MTVQYKIRTGTKNDTDKILQLLYELRPKPKTMLEKSSFTKKILQYISDKDKQMLVAYYDSEIAGLASIIFLSRLNRTKPELYIPELVVSKGYRRLGIGRSLIESCVVIAKNKNCFRIRLESGNQRKEAHKFYKSLGFEQHAQSYNLKLGQNRFSKP